MPGAGWKENAIQSTKHTQRDLSPIKSVKMKSSANQQRPIDLHDLDESSENTDIYPDHPVTSCDDLFSV